MSESAASIASDLLGRLKSHPKLRRVDKGLVQEAVNEWLGHGISRGDAALSQETIDLLAERILTRSKLSAEEVSIRAKLAVRLGTNIDELDAIVHRHFEGATRDIAERHLEAVRQERTRRITEGILAALGGRERASLEDILSGAARAVTESLAPLRPGRATLEPAVAAQVAQAVSQAVQQVALNVQKIITVAIESERSTDSTNPKYYYP